MEKKRIIDTVKLENGEYLEKKFNNCLDMAKHAVDWTLFCHYKLRTNCVEGIFKILQLSNMQLAYTKESGGIMYDFATPKESINISILIKIEDKALIQEMKLQTNMVVITKSEKIYNFISNKGVEILDISCNKDKNLPLYNALKPFIDKFFYDDDRSIQTALLNIFEHYRGEEKLDTQTMLNLEEQITKVILDSISIQEVNTPSFTKTEIVALKMREELFHYMDRVVSVETLATEYKIGVKSMQTAFMSLFGFTPSIFIRLMKLNLVNHNLLQATPSSTTVSRVAQKWGFKHMGRFSAYYQNLFLELPSETLHKQHTFSNGMSNYCVQRQDEI